MIGGQQLDLEGGHDLAELHRLKTGALFAASVMCGALGGGGAARRARALARVRGRARAALPGRRRHPRRRRLRAPTSARTARAASPTRRPSARRRGSAEIHADTSVLARDRRRARRAHRRDSAQAARRPARRARPGREPRAGAGARDGRARARAREAGRAGRRDAPLEVEQPPPYVSRAGHKLANALDAFGVDSAGLDCLDVGASTGGFTDVLLQRGAARVIALDVGYGQLHPKLRDDPRVTVLERTNARSLTELPFAPQLVTCDVSFISVRLALPPALAPRGARLAGARARQAAVRGGPAEAPKGVVRDPEVQRRVVREVAEALLASRGRAARRRRLGPARPEGKP